MLLLVALCLATAALTLLIARGIILEPLRNRLPEMVQTGVRCAFCVAFWISFFFVLGMGHPTDLPGWLTVLAVWGGASAVIGLAYQ